MTNLTLEEIDSTRTNLAQRHTTLESYRINELPGDITQLNSLFKEYIKTAGTDDSKLTGDAGMLGIIQKIDGKYTAYKTLTTDAANLMRQVSEQADIGARLQKIGDKQTSIRNLQKNIKELEQQVDSTDEREQILRTREETASYSQLFGGMDHPIKPYSIPVLLSLTVIFTMLGIYTIGQFFTGFGDITKSAISKSTSFISSSSSTPTTWKDIVLSPFVLITIIVGLIIGFALYAAKKDGRI